MRNPSNDSVMYFLLQDLIIISMKEQQKPPQRPQRIVSLIESPSSPKSPRFIQSTGINEAKELSTCQAILQDLLAKRKDRERSKQLCKQLRKSELKMLFSQLIDHLQADVRRTNELEETMKPQIKIQKANEEISNLSAIVGICQNDIKQLERQNLKKRVENNQLKKSRMKIQASLAQLQNENKELREKAKQLTKVEQQVERKQIQIYGLQIQTRQLKDEKLQLQSQITQLSRENEGLRSERSQHLTNLDNADLINNNQSIQIKQMQNELKDKEKQLEDIRKMHLERSIMHLPTSQSSLRDRNNESRLGRLDQQNQEIKRENLELEAQKGQLLSQLEALQDQFRISQAQNKKLKEQNTELTNQIRSNSQIEREFQFWKGQLRTKQQELDQERLEHLNRIKAHERQTKSLKSYLQQSHPWENSDEQVTAEEIKTYLQQRLEKTLVYERNELNRILLEVTRNQ